MALTLQTKKNPQCKFCMLKKEWEIILTLKNKAQKYMKQTDN